MNPDLVSRQSAWRIRGIVTTIAATVYHKPQTGCNKNSARELMTNGVVVRVATAKPKARDEIRIPVLCCVLVFHNNGVIAAPDRLYKRARQKIADQ
jgi:hypothetical protein